LAAASSNSLCYLAFSYSCCC